jgi:hypothetical protein
MLKEYYHKMWNEFMLVGHGPDVCSCRHGTKLPASVKLLEFLNQLRNYRFSKALFHEVRVYVFCYSKYCDHILQYGTRLLHYHKYCNNLYYST